MPNYIQITFQNLPAEQQELLIAHLAEACFEGFEENGDELKAFIAEKNYDKRLLYELAFKYQLTYKEQLIPEQNWNVIWESGFHPVTIDDFVSIRAEFHNQIAEAEHDIIITPKMSFGTGHHATTFMMMQQMRSIDFSGKKVFDFGTGTGILAILVEKLGAGEVIAMDNDDWSIANAAENFEKNHCRKISLLKDETPAGNEQYDIILANINKNIILENFSVMAHCLKTGGILLLSGLLKEDEAEIIQHASLFYLQLSGKAEEKNWICLQFSR